MGGLHPESYISGLQVRQRISRKQPKGLPIINMGFNEMPYPPPQSVVEAISGRALRAHRYGSAACNDLRQALAALHGLPAEQLFFEGKYAECAEIARFEFERGVWNERWPELLMQCHLETGRYSDALADTKQTLCMAPLYAEYCALLFSLSNYNKV